MKKYSAPVIFTLIILTMFAIFQTGCEQQVEEVHVDWVQSTNASLNIEQKIGQMFCLTIDPIRYFFYPDYKRNINTLVTKYNPGALFVVANLDTVKMEIRLEFNGHKLHDELVGLQRLSKVPMFIGADFSSGAWYWDNTATRFTYPLALGAIASGEYSFRQGKISSVEAKAQSINWLFMPNCLINPDNANITMLLETLGEDPAVITDLSKQTIRGIQEAGVAATVKYFPSYTENAILRSEPINMNKDQSAVFHACISSNVKTILTSPVNPLTAPENGADIWRANLQYLTDSLDYNGIIVTNFMTDLDTGNVQKEVEMIKAGIEGGTGMFILPEIFGPDIPLIDLLTSEVISDRYETEQIDKQAKKIVTEKFNIGLNKPKTTQSMMTMSGLGIPEYAHSSRDIAKESVTLLKNDGNLIPADKKSKRLVSIAFFDANSFSFSPVFKDKLKERSEDTHHINVFGAPDERIRGELRRRADHADVVLLSFFYRPENGGGTILPKELSIALKEIASINSNVVASSFYDPTLIKLLPDPKAYLAAYSPSEYSMEAVLDIILGNAPAHGKLPFTLSEKYPLNSGLHESDE